jgi:hypothetical protein
MSLRNLPGGKARTPLKAWQPHRHLWAESLEMWGHWHLATLWVATFSYWNAIFCHWGYIFLPSDSFVVFSPEITEQTRFHKHFQTYKPHTYLLFISDTWFGGLQINESWHSLLHLVTTTWLISSRSATFLFPKQNSAMQCKCLIVIAQFNPSSHRATNCVPTSSLRVGAFC